VAAARRKKTFSGVKHPISHQGIPAEVVAERRLMKTKYALLFGGILLSVLSATTSFAQANLATNYAANNAVNAATSIATNIASGSLTNAPADKETPELGQPLLSRELKETLRLTPAQQAEVKPIEDEFAKVRNEYEAANRARLEAAYEADR
jgi:hypothetical protein